MIVFFGKTFKQKAKTNEGFLLKLTKRVTAAPVAVPTYAHQSWGEIISI